MGCDKEEYKARLVARGFQELEKPQADSPTAQRESFKLFMALCSICDVESLKSVDIKAAFLQAEDLDRDVYMEAPKDVRKEGFLWRLKPLYGLNDASRKFWLKAKKIFQDEGMEPMPGDQASYVKRREGKPIGLVLTHVDDFTMGGTNDLVEGIIERLKKELTV